MACEALLVLLMIIYQFGCWLAVESVGCLLDLVEVALSTYFLWTLQMSLKRRLSSAAIFASRLLYVSITKIGPQSSSI